MVFFVVCCAELQYFQRCLHKCVSADTICDVVMFNKMSLVTLMHVRFNVIASPLNVNIKHIYHGDVCVHMLTSFANKMCILRDIEDAVAN